MKLLIADDHTLFRDTLKSYVERRNKDAVIAGARDIDGVMDVLKADPAQDLIFLDFKMPGMNGLEGLRRVRDAYPHVPVALVSGFAEKEDVMEALRMGAVAYFPKTLSGKALLRAMDLVLAGEKFVPLDFNTNDIMPSHYHDPDSNVTLLKRPKGDQKTLQSVGLTPREIEVLAHLSKGLSNKEIASAMGLQVVTVKLHVRGVCRKLEAKNRTQAALRAREMGLIQEQ